MPSLFAFYHLSFQVLCFSYRPFCVMLRLRDDRYIACYNIISPLKSIFWSLLNSSSQKSITLKKIIILLIVICVLKFEKKQHKKLSNKR